METSLNVF